MWWIPQHLVHIPHRPLLTPAMIRGLSRVDRRSLQAGLVGYRGHRSPPPARSRLSMASPARWIP
jgi:hypothetical protein